MKKQTVITIIVMVVIVGALAALAMLKGHSSKVPENPSDTVGNNSGNLNNMGYFCEHDGQIFFANAADGHKLYALDPTNMSAKKIANVPVAYINAAGDYVYYYFNDKGDSKFMGVSGNMRGLYRVNAKKNDSPKCLERTTSAIVALLGNKLYYQHYDNNEGMSLYSIDTNGNDNHQVINKIVNPACIIGGQIFYPDMENMFYLNVLDPVSESSRAFSEERMYNPILSGNYIYYMNINDNYCLYRFNLGDASLQKLTRERIDAYNVYGENVFYQTNSDSRPRLVKMNADGSAPEIIAEGNYTDINCTSYYTFFRAFDDELTFYMVPTASGTPVTTFNPIIEE